MGRIEQVASHLQHPRTVRVDADACDADRPRSQLHREEAHVPDGAEHTEGFDSEEIASAQRL
jgi:hypothetical protein